MSMIEDCIFCIQILYPTIHPNNWNVVNIHELKIYFKKHHVFITKKMTFLTLYNSGSSNSRPVKPYAAIDVFN